MEAGYFGVYLWAQAVLDSNTDKVEEVRNKVVRQSFNAPEGIVYVDENRHTWKTVRIGQIQENGQFSILWKSNGPVKPNPFPFFKSKEEWNRFLKNQYDQWKQNWAVPQERK